MLSQPRRRLAAVAFLVPVALLAAGSLRAQLAPVQIDRGGNGLGLALRRLGVTGRVLYVTAHPDDEHNGVLVSLARGRGLRTALLTLTRGEGGQNAVGPELGEALGVLRTEELMAVHRYDGVEQYFARAYEFGFSFSLEETLGKWGREETLGDVVRVFRTFRPDVVLTLALEAPDHQHHTASAQLAREAFRAAADPARFPEQIQAGLRPWQARKIYQGGVGGGPAASAPAGAVRLSTAAFDPLLGMSAQQLGGLARSAHRSQGPSAPQLLADPGSGEGSFLLVDSEPKVEGPEADVLDGVDSSLAGLSRFLHSETDDLRFLASGASAVEAGLAGARAAYDTRVPEKSVASLAAAVAAVRKLWDQVAQSRLSEATREELLVRLDDQEHEMTKALALAQGLVVEARLDRGTVVPGQAVAVTVSVFNQGTAPVTVDDASLNVPAGWTVSKKDGAPGPLPAGERVRWHYSVEVAPSAALSGPYWRRGARGDRYDIDATGAETLPWSRPELVAGVRAQVAGLPIRLETPGVFRYEGAAGGEKQHLLEVIPALSVRVTPDLAVFPLTAPRAPKEVRVSVTQEATGEGSATVHLETPPGWTVEPKEAPVHFERDGQEGAVRFWVTPRAPLAEFDGFLKAVAVRDGVEYRQTVQEIDYPHIQSRVRITPAEARLLALDVKTAPGAAVGYVMGTGDSGPEAIRQLGLQVTLLTVDDLAFADLNRYSTIVVGVRAYEVRDDLRSSHARLMRYVEGGGNVLVQYHRAGFNGAGGGRAASELGPVRDSPFAPWPASVTSNRITDETAKLELLVPSSPVFTAPNRLDEPDWSGWVQERAIQLLDVRDPRYVELLSSADPFPKNAGPKKGLLVETRVGKGTWTYTGLVLFRELPAGVPGAYRLFANLLSRPRGR